MIIRKSFTFDASHQLPFHDGKCANLHGHTYKLDVAVEGKIQDNPPNPQTGFVIDFSRLKKIVQEVILEKYDHKHLNVYFENPTAELMSIDIFKDLYKPIQEMEAELVSIRLWETATSFAEATLADYLKYQMVDLKKTVSDKGVLV